MVESSPTNRTAAVRKSRLRQRSSNPAPTDIKLSNTNNNVNINESNAATQSPTLQQRRRKRVASSSNARQTCKSFAANNGTLILVTIFVIFWFVMAFAFVSYSRGRNEMNAAGGDNSISNFLRKRLTSFQDGKRINQQSNLSAAASSSELIDMRKLNAELAFDNIDGGVWKQGWDIQLDESSNIKPLQIFVVPHSHNDPGWIKTFDEYFQTQTKQIIDTVVDALLADSKRTFIWAEISYLSWWWNDQTAPRREQLRQLLKNKQLELVTGGWVQPDEANSEYYALEVQLVEGHDWIRANLGEEFVPQYGWAIDPFGYSPTMAYQLKRHGFKAMLIQRVHYAVKKHLAWNQQLEFNWRQTWDKSGEHDMFTHLMPFYSYDVPHTCGPDPSVCCQFDFHRLPVGRGPGCPWGKGTVAITPANVAERAMTLLDQYRKKAQLYRSNAVLIPLGDDFRYQDKVEAENQFTNHQLIHDYINQHVHGVEIKFATLGQYFEAVMGTFEPPLLKGSFFTYSDVNEDYWSGYFTSRVFDKALDRQLERVLFAAESLNATKEELREARRQLSLFQHHDGVTGTAKDHVVEDYAKRMFESVTKTQQWMLNKVKDAFPQETGVINDLNPCWIADAPRGLSQNLCGEEGTVIVYNPLETTQACGPVVVPGRQAKLATLPCEAPGPAPESLIRMEFNATTGLMTHPIKEEWKFWKVRAGGAYLFAPGDQKDYDMSDVIIEDGGYVVSTPQWKRTIVEKKVSGEFGTKARVLDFIYEFYLDKNNQEWFIRFSRDIKNNGIFHTDLNGFNFDTHKFRADLPIQSQVYPMPTLASIEDQRVRMSVLSEHAQGTASLVDGSIDVWLDRRLQQDDNRGLGQGVQDNRPTRTRFRVLLEADGFIPSDWEFEITPLCRRMWEELQHPLEQFGMHSVALSPANEIMLQKAKQNRARIRERQQREIITAKQPRSLAKLPFPANAKAFSVWNNIKRLVPFGEQRLSDVVRSTKKVPFVYMVYKRVDYLKKAIESLRISDYPKERVPLIISHDGHVPEVVSYVESLKGEFQIIQLFHPHSCYEHPDTFPGDDPKLNEKYQGDGYGNPRSAWVTCCKHHFTWMLHTVFDTLEIKNDDGSKVDTFLFLEEDYVVGPTVYRAIIAGLEVVAHNGDLFFGVGLDPSDGNAKSEPYWIPRDSWFADTFHSGPMTLSRSMYERIQQNAVHYCRFDDYNWDWSLVHLMGENLLPHAILLPRSAVARHIGVADGMHTKQLAEYGPNFYTLKINFLGSRGLDTRNLNPERAVHRRGYGGWSHPMDQEHCMTLLSSSSTINV
ncbi:alpha-mannosidase 2 [Mayamaea pseudoterrestris]|nr:alpha-mannosidase 2 [Mayamaea pseudoterrestris]